MVKRVSGMQARKVAEPTPKLTMSPRMGSTFEMAMSGCQESDSPSCRHERLTDACGDTTVESTYPHQQEPDNPEHPSEHGVHLSRVSNHAGCGGVADFEQVNTAARRKLVLLEA